MPRLLKCFRFPPGLLDLLVICSLFVALEGTGVNADFISIALCNSRVPAPIPGA